jgi:hypothetical protein
MDSELSDVAGHDTRKALIIIKPMANKIVETIGADRTPIAMHLDDKLAF